MQKITEELTAILSDYVPRLHQISDADFALRPSPRQWSRKEIVGHLIDSAQNNLRRFICAQYESSPPAITYQQNFWVTAIDYQHWTSADVIRLWRLINMQLISVLTSMPPENDQMLCKTDELRTIEWLASDYIRHLKHHLHQVFPLPD